MSVWLEKKSGLTVVRWDEWIAKEVDGVVVRTRIKHTSSGYEVLEKAKVAARELEARLPRRSRFRSHGPRPHTDAPLMELVEQWGASKLAESPPAIQPYTVEVYRQAIGRVVRLRNWGNAGDITKGAILDWRQAVKGKGFARTFAYLRSVLHWAHDHRGQAVDDYILHPPRQSHGPRRPPPGELLAESDVKAVIAAAKRVWFPGAVLLHCLSIYAARGATYVRMTVKDYNGKRRKWTLLHVKHTDPVTHPLFLESVRMLDRITKGRGPDEPLFLSPWGGGWKITKQGRSQQVTDWYRRLAKSLKMDQAGIYRLKNYAISRMKRGLAPWPRPVASKEGIQFTGHKLTASFDAYARTNQDELRLLVGIRPRARGGS